MYRYRVTVEALSENPEQPSLTFEVVNHDDIPSIARRLSGKVAMDEDATKAFAVGLKLFGETILQNRENPLFVEIRPAFVEFMKKLKQQV